MQKNKLVISAILLAFALAGGVAVRQLSTSSLPEFTTAYAQPEAIALPAFKLGEQGQFSNSLFNDKWSLIFFGYGSCPDVCPTELYNLNNVAKILTAEGKIMPQVLFISVDSKRDSNEMLSTYARFYNDDFLGMTGDSSEVDKLVTTFGVIYEKTFMANNGQYVAVPYTSPLPPEHASSYLINHSSRVYLVNPQGEYVAAFAPPHSAEKMAADLAKL